MGLDGREHLEMDRGGHQVVLCTRPDIWELWPISRSTRARKKARDEEGVLTRDFRVPSGSSPYLHIQVMYDLKARQTASRRFPSKAPKPPIHRRLLQPLPWLELIHQHIHLRHPLDSRPWSLSG